jgi:hypothetical protein
MSSSFGLLDTICENAAYVAESTRSYTQTASMQGSSSLLEKVDDSIGDENEADTLEIGAEDGVLVVKPIVKRFSEVTNLATSSQASSKSLKTLLLEIECYAVETENSHATSFQVTVSAINQHFEPFRIDIAELSDDDFTEFSRSLINLIMILSKREYSTYKGISYSKTSIAYKCVNRKNDKCQFSFKVNRNLKRSENVLLTPLSEGHSADCSEVAVEAIRKSKNFRATQLLETVEHEILLEVSRIHVVDKSLKPRQIKRQVESALSKRTISDPPKSLVRRLLDTIRKRLDENGTDQRHIRNSVENLLDKLALLGIEYKVVYSALDQAIVDAVYWVDKKIHNVERVKKSHIIVHDTSFGVVNPISGFQKISILATVEHDGNSQILVTGISVSDTEHVFRGMLQLLKDEFNSLCSKRLFIYSDEDRAFLNACAKELPDARNFICLWHKKKNFKKPRRLRKNSKNGNNGNNQNQTQELDAEDEGVEESENESEPQSQLS